MGRGRKRSPRSHPPANSSIGDSPALGTRPPGEAIRRLGLATAEELAVSGGTSSATEGSPFASLIPWLTSLSTAGSPSDPADPKPTRYLTAKGLPTLLMKVVQKVWNFEFVEMEDLLPAPRSLRLVEQGVASSSLQESLVGALNQFQAQQQHRAKRRVTDIMTCVRCFSLYMAVLSKKEAGMVPSMVAHLHTVLRLHQRASSQLAWLEYDIQFRMELEASADRAWTSGDPWQYVACLAGQRTAEDPFDITEAEATKLPKGKGKRPAEHEGERGSSTLKQAAKRSRRAVCRLFNTAPRGCPYGKECIFAHRCTSCGSQTTTGMPVAPRHLRGWQTGQPPHQRGRDVPTPKKIGEIGQNCS